MNIRILFEKVKRNLPQFTRFGVVGSSGVVINFTVYYCLVEFLDLSLNISTIAAFGVAVVNNYVLNHFWTFALENEGNALNIRQLFYYVVGNLQGLVINLITLNLVVYYFGIESHLEGQALGVIFGMLSNFLFAKKIVFSEKINRQKEKC